jgi:hypothetical protein
VDGTETFRIAARFPASQNPGATCDHSGASRVPTVCGYTCRGHRGSDGEDPHHVVESIMETRRFPTENLAAGGFGTELKHSLQALRASSITQGSLLVFAADFRSVDSPETCYARTADGVHLAYQVVGDGPIDLLYVPGWVNHVEWAWENPTYGRLLGRLSSFSRLIVFDKRGLGLSDRPERLLTLEDQTSDVGAVLEAVGWKRAVLFVTLDAASPVWSTRRLILSASAPW